MFKGCADDFHCTYQGQSPVIDGVDDAKEMNDTRKAFSLLGKWKLHFNKVCMNSKQCILNRQYCPYAVLVQGTMDHTFLFYCPVFLVGISESDQMEIYQILASILHLSNVEIKDQSADRSSISVITDYTWTRFLFLLYFTLEYCIEDVLRLFPSKIIIVDVFPAG